MYIKSKSDTDSESFKVALRVPKKLLELFMFLIYKTSEISK